MINIFETIKNFTNNQIAKLTEFLILRGARKSLPDNSTSNSSLIPRNKFAIAFANLFELAGLTRKEVFYKCDYDLYDIKAAINTDSYLKVAVQKYKQLFFKAGYSFKGRNDAAIEYLEKRFRIMEYCTNQSMGVLLRELAGDLEAYSNAFLIKTRVKEVPFINAKGTNKSGKPVGGYFRVSPSSIQVQYDEAGKIKAYKQVTIGNREKIFQPEDVIHFVLDKEPGSIWGTPRWVAALEDVKLLRKVEANVLALIYRFVIPLYQVKIGLPQPGLEGTKKEIDDAKRELEIAPLDGIMVTNERTEVKTVGAEGNALDVSGYLSYFERRVFSAINISEAMMGRGGSKQDADSMQELVHNIVKDDQQMFALQFKSAVIDEILLEGGYNPILNEEDIVNLDFTEINLDTKVKMENHELNKFEKNAITFEELRQHLGEKKDNVDEDRLYSNMIQQKNTLEQMQMQADSAMDLAQYNGDLALQQAKIAASNRASSTPSSSNSSSSKKKINKTSSYTKKNTGNGKTINTTVRSKTVSSNDSPSNQHGTFSAKIKESLSQEKYFDNHIKDIYEQISQDLLSHELTSKDVILSAYQQKILDKINIRLDEAASKGTYAAFADNKNLNNINKNNEITKNNSNNNYIAPNFLSGVIKNYTKDTIKEIFCDINKKIGNTTNRNDIINSLDTLKYRVRFLTDFAENKSYWYSYLKALSFQGIKEAEIIGDKNSKHNCHHGIIKTSDFDINDIPGYSTGCNCYITPVIHQKGDGN